jgi:protein-disulfide isomerase
VSHWRALVAGLVLTLASAGPGLTQTPKPASSDLETLKQQVQQLIAGQEAMRQQLEEIRSLLRVFDNARLRPAQGGPPLAAAPLMAIETVVDVTGAPIQGASSAALTVIEYSDFECSFCGQFARQTFAEIERDYVQPGRVRYAFRHFPIEQLHPRAFKAGVAAACAGAQDKFWEMHDRLYANQKALDVDALTGYGRDLGLNQQEYERCLKDETPAARIRQDLEEGRAAGVRSTPTFLIGFAAPDDPGKVRAVRLIRGAQPFAMFKAELDKLLKP